MKRGFVVTGAVMLVTTALLGYCHVRTTQLDAAFNKLKVGDAERDVIAKMGRPHQVLDGCGYYGRPIVGCARRMRRTRCCKLGATAIPNWIERADYTCLAERGTSREAPTRMARRRDDPRAPC
jgi:hypothetical protein